MATLTSTAMSQPAQAPQPGVNSVTVLYNGLATQISASATTILMAKVPTPAKILDFIQQHSTGSLTCPMDVGVDSDLDALATAATQAAVSRATAGVPYQVSLSDGAVNRFSTVKCTVTPGTATASVKINLTVLYKANSSSSEL